MAIVYIIILTLSTAFLAGAFVRINEQLAPLMQREGKPVGALVTFPILGFLMVILLPMPVIVAALFCLVIGWWDDTRGLLRDMGLALLLLAASIAIAGMQMPVIPSIPSWALVIAGWLFWWGLMLGAGYLPTALPTLTVTCVIASLPLLAAPLLSNAPASIGADIALIISGLIGALLGARKTPVIALSLRLPLACLYGFLVLRAALFGGWVFALASLIIAIAVCTYHARRQPQWIAA
jgi:hypothetical protein